MKPIGAMTLFLIASYLVPAEVWAVILVVAAMAAVVAGGCYFGLRRELKNQ
jgi:hypothetical protein